MRRISAAETLGSFYGAGAVSECSHCRKGHLQESLQGPIESLPEFRLWNWPWETCGWGLRTARRWLAKPEQEVTQTHEPEMWQPPSAPSMFTSVLFAVFRVTSRSKRLHCDQNLWHLRGVLPRRWKHNHRASRSGNALMDSTQLYNFN